MSIELYLGLDGLGLADEKLGEGGVEAAARAVAVAEVDGVVGRSVERVPRPLDEAEDNGVLLPRQKLPHRVQAEPGGRGHDGQQQRLLESTATTHSHRATTLVSPATTYNSRRAHTQRTHAKLVNTVLVRLNLPAFLIIHL